MIEFTSKTNYQGLVFSLKEVFDNRFLWYLLQNFISSCIKKYVSLYNVKFIDIKFCIIFPYAVDVCGIYSEVSSFIPNLCFLSLISFIILSKNLTLALFVFSFICSVLLISALTVNSSLCLLQVECAYILFFNPLVI